MKHHRDWRGSTALEFKDANGGGEPDPVKAIEELQAAIAGKFDASAIEIKKLSDKLDAEIAKRNRPGTETKAEGEQVERKAFETFLRKGKEALGPDEVNSAQTPHSFNSENLQCAT